jgi:3-keto-disaccharide hydrolase
MHSRVGARLPQNADARFRRTGAIYNMPGQNLDDTVVARGAGQWNDFEIRVRGNRILVFLNGQQRTDFTNADPNRGQGVVANRFIGLQTHTGRVLFRNIQIRQHP